MKNNDKSARKVVVVLTGAGVSAESGIPTFRDANGLWENHNVQEVASPEGWRKNPALVQRFYNERRRKLHEVEPNLAHIALAELEKRHDVVIITQNIDNLHERAGSTAVVHLHGELLKARSTADPSLVYDWPGDIEMGDVCPKGGQLRPHIVWFGEDVPLIHKAAELCAIADMLLIIGTSMQVYPAAGLVEFAQRDIPKFYIDKNPAVLPTKIKNLKTLAGPASEIVPELLETELFA